MEELQQIGLADGQKLKLDHDDLDALLAGRRTSMLRLEDLAFDDNRGQTSVSPLERAIRGAENSPVLIRYGALLVAILLVLALGVRPALRSAGFGKQKCSPNVNSWRSRRPS